MQRKTGFEKKGHALAAVAAYKRAIATAPKSNLKKDKLLKFVNDTKNKIDVINEKLSSRLIIYLDGIFYNYPDQNGGGKG